MAKRHVGTKTVRAKGPKKVLVGPLHGSVWERSVLRGIVRHGVATGTIRFGYAGLGELSGPLPWQRLLGRGIDGVIARLYPQEFADAIVRSGLPAVNVSNVVLPGIDIPRVAIDLEAVAVLAADHLAGLGLKSFAYMGVAGFADCVLQREAFVARLATHGIREVPTFWDTIEDDIDSTRLEAFLRDLPKPVGLFTRIAAFGLFALRACEAAGIAVPDEVAVLAGDDDPILAEAFSPSLSAVDIAAERVGVRAVEVLESLLTGRTLPQDQFLLPPLGIISRKSTDVFVSHEPAVAGALRYIRDHYHEPLQINHVARHARVSRRLLEKLFHDTLGRSPLQEVRRVRLAEAKNRLVMSDDSLKVIAKACGFSTPQLLIRSFTRDVGMSPGRYRESHRLA